MKKIITLLILSLSLLGCISTNAIVIRTFERKFPQDKFYFVQGLDYKFDLMTHIRYRGILYSDRLEKMGYPFGLHMALEGSSDGFEYLENYEGLLLKIEVDKPIEKKMKEIFGEKSVLDNNFYPSLEGFKEMLKKIGKKVDFNEKGRADYTIVNVFVDRLEDIDKEKMKRKTYDFAKFLCDEINLKTSLQVYIRDNTFFEDYNLVRYQVYPPFREREDIQKIFEKIKNRERITEKEKIALVNVFYKGFSYNMRYTSLYTIFSREELKSYEKQRFSGMLIWEDYIDE